MHVIAHIHTGSNDIVDDNNLLTRLDSASLHLEEVGTVLLLVALSFTGTGELALLANGDKGSTEAQGQTRAHQETAGLQTDDDIGLDAAGILEDVQLQGTDESLVQGRVGEDRQDILEENAGGREVRELTQGAAQAYFKTGEFGGAGGMGGGVSGDLGGGIGGGG